MKLYIPETNIISFTHKCGNVTHLTATAVQKYATVTITSVHKGTIMTAIKVFLLPFCTINLGFTTIVLKMLESMLLHMVKQLAISYSVNYWYSATFSWWLWKSVKNSQLFWHLFIYIYTYIYLFIYIWHMVPTLLADVRCFGDGQTLNKVW